MDILTGIQICLIAILGDTLLGWLFAFIRGEFDIRQAPRFLQTAVLPYVGNLLIVAGLAYIEPGYMPGVYCYYRYYYCQIRRGSYQR